MDNSLRKGVLIGLCFVAIAGAIYIFLTRSGSAPPFPTEYAYQAVCLACHETVPVKRSKDQHEPLVCPKCEKQAVYGWMFCSACNKRIVPEMVRDGDGVRRVPMTPVCPLCKGTNVGAYVPELHDPQSTGDGPFPAWP